MKDSGSMPIKPETFGGYTKEEIEMHIAEDKRRANMYFYGKYIFRTK